jgi:hypothetical protein
VARRALLIWLLPLLAVNIVADYAKVRAVVEDRRSMLGALAAGARFVARHPVAAVGLYLTNTLVLAVCFSLYLLAAPGAHGGDWRLLEVLVIGQAWILARVTTKLGLHVHLGRPVPGSARARRSTRRRRFPSGPSPRPPKPSRTPSASVSGPNLDQLQQAACQ